MQLKRMSLGSVGFGLVALACAGYALFEALAWSAEPESNPQGRVLRGHTGPVLGVTFSPDGRFVASASGQLDPTRTDFSIRLWDVKTGNQVQKFVGHSDAVHRVAFLPDGKSLLSTGNDGTIRLWDVTTGKETRRLNADAGAIIALALSPAGKFVASAGEGGTICITEVATGELVRRVRGSTAYVRAVAYAPDGHTLASGGDDKILRLWDPTTGKEKARLRGHGSPISSMAFSPDGKSLLCCDQQNLILWSVADRREIRRFVGHRDTITCVAYAPDGRRLLSASGRNYSGRPTPTHPDFAARLWDAKTGRELLRMQGHDGPVFAVACSPDGRWAATGSFDQTVRLWELPP